MELLDHAPLAGELPLAARARREVGLDERPVGGIELAGRVPGKKLFRLFVRIAQVRLVSS